MSAIRTVAADSELAMSYVDPHSAVSLRMVHVRRRSQSLPFHVTNLNVSLTIGILVLHGSLVVLLVVMVLLVVLSYVVIITIA